jgi:biotin---protein ligase
MIRDYVAEGGSYLGICAGSYFASSRVEFEVGRSGYEVTGNRSLALTSRKAVGSVSKQYVYGSDSGAEAKRFSFNPDFIFEEEVRLYVNGGPVFLPFAMPAANTSEEILAVYADTQMPAILHTKLGHGNAILTSPHVEISYSEIETTRWFLDRNSASYKRLTGISPFLKHSENARMELFRNLLQRLGLDVAIGYGNRRDIAISESKVKLH